MAEDFKDTIDAITALAAAAPSVKEAITMVVEKITEQIGVHREDGPALELLAEKLKESAGSIGDAVVGSVAG